MQSEAEIVSKIFSSSPDAIIISDLNNNILDCNQATLNLFNYPSKNEIIGKNFIELFPDKEHSRIVTDIITVMEKGLLKDKEYIFHKKNGDEFIGFISSSTIRNDSPPELYILSTIKDITKIKLARQRLQAIFDGIKDGILIINRNYEILRVNSGILRIFTKKNFSDLLGKACFTELYNNKEICEICPAREAFRNGKPCYATKICQTTNKEKLVFDLSAFPIKDPDGKVSQVIVLVRDVTDRIKLEDLLISQERMAAIGELASGLAHEIRNPLGNISASAQYCLNKYELPSSVKKYLKIIIKNSENANKIIKDLLNFSRQREISFETGDIGEVIKSACNLINAKCLKQKVRMIFRLPKKLPRILLDEKRLIEAFTNLILNALDAMPDGGKLTITAYSDFQNKEIVISFLDTGKGIPKEYLNKIFEPFFTTKKEGVGLGLCLVLQVINDHKGKIHIDSKPGQGTEVEVRLPISRK